MEGTNELRNPFRSEADAFRLLVIIGVSIAAIVAAAALGGATVGVPVALILLAAAVRASFRWLRQSLQAPEEDPDGGQPPSPPPP
ncbi:MAG: hypothetical protein WBB30_03175 [Solirubrobacterales bacterium]